MTIVYDHTGAIIARSKNLRGLLDHARRVPPVSARLVRFSYDGPYQLRVKFSNGSYAIAPFADWRVAADWIKARRSWGRIDVDGLPEFVERAA